jgi:glycolate oxidase FAD binding subunit
MTPASCLSRLEKLLGPGQVRSDPAERASYAVDGVLPSAVLLPNDPAEAAEVVRFAAAEKLAVIPCGARTKLGMGIPPSRYDLALDVTRLNQIAHYDPADLTLSVDAGLPLTQLSSVLAAQKQFLPLAVPFFAQTTIGGTIASGVDSPLRQLYGSARDFVIGAEFING